LAGDSLRQDRYAVHDVEKAVASQKDK